MSSTMTDALTDLFARAGASDTDREAWLAERRQGVTATEIRDIMLASNRELAIKDLVKKKREGDSFTGNAYTEWGREREPVIGAWLVGFGVTSESRVFHAVGNSRHLASPDGIAQEFDGSLVLDEVKTCGHPLPKGSAELAAKGYEWQMQWCCHVTGAGGSWLTVELRHGTPREGFTAGERTREFFPRDEAMIAEMVAIADLVLTAMDAEPVEEVIDEAVDTHAVNYLRGLSAEKEGKALKETAYAALIAAGVSQESPLARVTFTPGKPGGEFVDEVIDLDAAAAAHPKETAALERAKARVEKLQAEWDALANEHTKTVRTVIKGTGARVTVTAGKGTRS